MNTNREVLMLILVSGLISLATKSRGEKCPDLCGNVTIPFPFGTREGCYLDENFLITCNHTTNTSTLGNVTVLDISVPDGQLTVSFFAASDCYDKSGIPTHRNDPWFSLKSFHISSTRNKFIAIGCDTYAYVQGLTIHGFSAGCLSLCNNVNSVVNGSCSGIGCCETSIPNGMTNFDLEARSYYNHNYTMPFNPCSYAFIVKDGEYNFSISDLSESFVPPDTYREFPMVIDWAIGNENCAQARKDQTAYACKSNSVCVDSVHGRGYLCNCSEGYSGNPYTSKGCEDIDECMNPDLNQCISQKHCRNTVGSYNCFCPKGLGDGEKGGRGCISVAAIAGVSVAIPSLSVVIFCVYCGIQKRKIGNRKQNLFKENGGLMLEQLLSKIEQPEERAKIFTEEELKKATNNFSKTQIIGQGGYGTVYKGALGNKSVAVKKSKVMDSAQIDQFINEVIVLSQINHPNVVKLLGCCLETPVPLLVYEFITNNTLHYHLHDKSHLSPMPWETRSRIAAETAAALAHMHSDAPIRIIHRDVKSANILLDDNFTAKVSDFGVSRLVPLDQTHLSTLVQGTIGYLDPQYFHSGLLSEKSDVYSFGVVLVELLTGERVLSPDRSDENKSLVSFFESAMRDDRLFQILDVRVKNERYAEQHKGVADLAMRCLRLNGEKRPTMKEVKRQLEELMVDKYIGGREVVLNEDLEPLLGPSSNFFDGSSSIGLDSMKSRAVLELSDVFSGR